MKKPGTHKMVVLKCLKCNKALGQIERVALLNGLEHPNRDKFIALSQYASTYELQNVPEGSDPLADTTECNPNKCTVLKSYNDYG